MTDHAHRPDEPLDVSIRDPLGNFARGFLMGSADLVPGVSGGTMALITGIYERLVATVRAITGIPLALLRADLRGARAQARRTEWLLIGPVLLGMLTAIVLGAGYIPGLIERHPENMNALFFGLILASLPVPWMMIEQRGRREVAIAAVAAVLAFVLTGLPPGSVTDPSLVLVFLAAAVAICAMVLPGVSGSFLLLVFGMYEVTLHAVHEREMLYLAVFSLGALAGLAGFSRVLGWLLEHHHVVTLAALVGLMVGSLRALWPWQEEDRTLLAPPADGGELGMAVGAAVLGFALVTVIVHGAARRAGTARADEE